MSSTNSASVSFHRTLIRIAGMLVLLTHTAHPREAADSQQYGISALIDGTAMVSIPAGEFVMGSRTGNADEQPPHRVRITRPFQMSKFEITQTQWQTVMTQAHARPDVPLKNSQGVEVSRNPSHFKGASLPVENVSWDDVELFVKRLNERDPQHIYRLPTEAEWEYASRAGKSSDAPDPGAWCNGISDERTHPVGEKQPNAWGLYDMQGNVAEWVQDWYGREYYEESALSDPAGPRTGSYRIFRGGSWLDPGKNCRSAYRGFDFPINRFYNVGFRIVRTPR